VSALPDREPAASRAVPGSIAAAQWAQIQAAAPQVMAAIQRYLQRLAAFLAPASVTAAENALRQFARWMITDAGLDSIAAVRRDDIEDYKVWLAAPAPGRRPDDHGRDAPAAAAHCPGVLRADHRVGLARRAAPQPGHRRGHPEKARADRLRIPKKARTSGAARLVGSPAIRPR
jgi:hypothetical protein